MSAKLWWHPGVPAEVQDAVRPHLDRWLSILPTWCAELGVRFDPEEENAASMRADKPYRRATLYIGAHWLVSSFSDREEVIRHEFCHVILAPLTDWTKDLIGRLTGEDERLDDWLREEWRQRLEGATCDLEAAFRRSAEGGL